MLKKLPVGIQSFREIRENNYIYVDKTQHILNMIERGKVYFLSRPRRFGKSLIVSTLEELFKGSDYLFENLYIYDKWNWDEEYPVIVLDLSDINYNSSEELKFSLEAFVEELAEEYSIKLKQIAYSSKFSELIRKISKSLDKKVVVLIDEYDKPIIDNITDLKIAEANRRILHDFHQVLKTNDKYLKFVFLTGVSKFSGTSIFSGLNNPDNITLDEDYWSICGYTHIELEKYFNEYIKILSDKESSTYDKTLEKINFWYDGYSWDGINKVYNPFSTLLLFKKRKFSNHWFKTGTPTFLMDLLEKENNLTPILEPIIAVEDDLDAFDIENIAPITLLFQTGYLTIKKEKSTYYGTEYILDIPNFEVKKSLVSNLLSAYTGIMSGHLKELRDKTYECIFNKDPKGLTEVLEEIYHQISYRIKKKNEGYYHSIFLVILYLFGIEQQGEVSTLTGSIDVMFKFKGQIIITEAKYSSKKSLDTLLNEAFTQIKNKKYYNKYRSKNPIFLALTFTNEDIACEFRETLTG
jgi:hypothetical protein